MPRPLRLQYPGAVYHIMARGNHQGPIVDDDRDRQRWLETLAEACEKTGWRVHAYVLMNNHFHLLVATPEPNLSDGMKWLQSTYTSRYNRRHQLFGHLFQGRYKALVLDGSDPYYLQVASTYIHLNPARAGLIRIGQDKLKRYRWSSYPWYLSRRAPYWLCRDQVLGSLRLVPGQTKGYEAYLESRVLELGLKAGRKELERQWEKLRRGWYLGGESFRERMRAFLDKAVSGRRRESHSGPAKAAHDADAAERQLQRGLRALGLRTQDLASLPKGAPEKTALAWWLRGHTTVSLAWVAERLGMGHPSRVSQAVARMKRLPGRRLKRLQRVMARCAINHDQK